MTKKMMLLAVAVLAFSSRIVITRALQGPVHAPDGSNRETITSIAVPPIPDAPFSASVDTEWTRYLDNGSTRLLKNHRLIARDGRGRVFQERRMLAPDGDPIQSQLSRIELAELQTHTVAYCDARSHVCELRFYRPPAATVETPAGPAGGANSFVREDLGLRTVSGLDLVGTRETQKLSLIAAGTDQPLTVTKEFWYSRQLGLNIVTKRDDPRTGREVFTVNDIHLTEPDPSLFTLPADARIVDYRTPAAPRSLP
jgi:hypothetical protein